MILDFYLYHMMIVDVEFYACNYIYTNDDSTTNPIFYSMVTQLTPKYTLSEIRQFVSYFSNMISSVLPIQDKC